MTNQLMLPSDHIFSYSQISSFDQCPHAFYLKYLLRVPDQQNAYAQYGTLAHEILEKWALNEISIPDMAKEWKRRYDGEVTVPFPPYPKGFRQKAFLVAEEYFNNFTGFGDNYDIISAEQTYVTKIGGCSFRGIIDLVLRDKTTGQLVVIDHKSKSIASLKRETGSIRQLYAYARFVKESYGEYPAVMSFNLFKEGGLMVDREFSLCEYMEVINWIETNMALISMETEWEAKYQNYFCQHICGVRNMCETALGMSC